MNKNFKLLCKAHNIVSKPADGKLTINIVQVTSLVICFIIILIAEMLQTLRSQRPKEAKTKHMSNL